MSTHGFKAMVDLLICMVFLSDHDGFIKLTSGPIPAYQIL